MKQHLHLFSITFFLGAFLLFLSGANQGNCQPSPVSSESIGSSSAVPLAASDSAPIESSSSVLATGTPEEVLSGFYLLSAGQLDFQNSNVPLDFYFWITFPGTETPKIEFMNSRSYTMNLQTSEVQTTLNGSMTNIVYRVNGVFDQDLDMKRYPFDRFEIRILAEDTEKNIQTRLFVPDLGNSAIDPSFRIAGWNVAREEIHNVTHTYLTSFGSLTNESGKETYSQLLFQMNIARDNTIIFVKTVSPVILFLLIAILGLFLYVDQISQKISLSVAAMFSSVAYHINVSQGLPPVGYLTFIDKMMICQYAVIFLNLLFCVAIFWANRHERSRLEFFLTWLSRIGIPLVSFSVFYFLFSQVEF